MSVFTARKLKEARNAANLSQEDVAKVLGITDWLISLIFKFQIL